PSRLRPPPERNRPGCETELAINADLATIMGLASETLAFRVLAWQARRSPSGFWPGMRDACLPDSENEVI
ncbi:MAG: hypothetical protein JSU96_06230, partial [Acidobacteriota bacterium]